MIPINKGYKPLEELQGLCKTCIGDCLRLEDINFKGIYRCKNYEKDERRKKNDKII